MCNTNINVLNNFKIHTYSRDDVGIEIVTLIIS